MWPKISIFVTDAVDMIIRMFPPFPIPGFAPNFTDYYWDQMGIDWYEMHRTMAQAPETMVQWVSSVYMNQGWKIASKNLG